MDMPPTGGPHHRPCPAYTHRGQHTLLQQLDGSRYSVATHSWTRPLQPQYHADLPDPALPAILPQAIQRRGQDVMPMTCNVAQPPEPG